MIPVHPLIALVGDVKRKWVALGIPIRPGASVERIRVLEERLGRKLPPPFAFWLRETGGMDREECDDEMMRFWPIEEIEAQDPGFGMARWKGTDFLSFIDWSISAHFYAVNLSEEQASVWLVYGKGEPMRIARSFEEFLRDYLADSTSMFREI